MIFAQIFTQLPFEAIVTLCAGRLTSGPCTRAMFAIRLARQRAIPSFVAATASAATTPATATATTARTLLVLAAPRCGARFAVAAIVLITGTGFRAFSA